MAAEIRNFDVAIIRCKAICFEGSGICDRECNNYHSIKNQNGPLWTKSQEGKGRRRQIFKRPSAAASLVTMATTGNCAMALKRWWMQGKLGKILAHMMHRKDKLWYHDWVLFKSCRLPSGLYKALTSRLGFVAFNLWKSDECGHCADRNIGN